MRKLYSAFLSLFSLSILSRRSYFILIGLVLPIVPQLSAQVSSYNDQTLKPIEGAGHDYIKLLAETVNPSNGSLNINVTPPLAPSRGFTVPFTVGYGSGGAYAVTAEPSSPRSVAGGGWSFNLPSISDDIYSTQAYIGGQNGVSCEFATDFLMTDLGGVQHDLNLALASYVATPGGSGLQYEPCGSANMQGGDTVVGATLTGVQSPGSVTVSYVDVRDLQGFHYHFTGLTGGGPTTSTQPDYIEDRNGNRAVFQTSNGFGYTDTNGRTAVAIPANAMQPSGSSTVTVSGLPYLVSWRQAAANYSVPYQRSYEVGSPYGCDNLAAVNSSESVISSILLPNQQSYQFFYGDNPTDPSLANPYGLISEIIYPNGGWLNTPGSSVTLRTNSYPFQPLLEMGLQIPAGAVLNISLQ